MKYKPLSVDQVLERINERCMACLNEDNCQRGCAWYEVKRIIKNQQEEIKRLKCDK